MAGEWSALVLIFDAPANQTSLARLACTIAKGPAEARRDGIAVGEVAAEIGKDNRRDDPAPQPGRQQEQGTNTEPRRWPETSTRVHRIIQPYDELGQGEIAATGHEEHQGPGKRTDRPSPGWQRGDGPH
jgi:hypothetical protein